MNSCATPPAALLLSSRKNLRAHIHPYPVQGFAIALARGVIESRQGRNHARQLPPNVSAGSHEAEADSLLSRTTFPAWAGAGGGAFPIGTGTSLGAAPLGGSDVIKNWPLDADIQTAVQLSRKHFVDDELIHDELTEQARDHKGACAVTLAPASAIICLARLSDPCWLLLATASAHATARSAARATYSSARTAGCSSSVLSTASFSFSWCESPETRHVLPDRILVAQILRVVLRLRRPGPRCSSAAPAATGSSGCVSLSRGPRPHAFPFPLPCAVGRSSCSTWGLCQARKTRTRSWTSECAETTPPQPPTSRGCASPSLRLHNGWSPAPFPFYVTFRHRIRVTRRVS